MDNEITKVANKEKVMKNLKAGHSPMKAVQAAYPDWSDDQVKAYIAEMGLEKKASTIKVASYNELTEQGMKITQAAFMDEIEKIAGKGALFGKAVKAIKNMAGKGAKAADKAVRKVGKAASKATNKATKGKYGKGDLRKAKVQRKAGAAAIGAGAAGAYGVKKAID